MEKRKHNIHDDVYYGKQEPSTPDCSKGNEAKFGEWQLCPKCHGTGFMNPSPLSSNAMPICDVCNGAKILARPIINNSFQQ